MAGPRSSRILPADAPGKGAALLLVVFALFAAGTIVAARQHFVRQRAAVETQVYHELAAIAQIKARQVGEWRNERLGDALTIQASAALMPELGRVLARGDPAAERAVRAWIESWFSHRDIVNAILLDANGRVRLTLGKAGGATRHYEELADQILRGGVTVFTDFHRDSGLPGVHLGLNIPLRGGGGKPVGVLLMGIDPNTFLYPLMQTWPTPSASAESLLVRRAGDDVLYLNELRHRKNTALNLRLPLSRPNLPAALAVKGHEGGAHGVDYRGVSVLASAARVPGTPWYVIAKVDSSEVYGPLRQNSVLLTLMAAALIAAAGAGTGLVWRSQRARFYQERYEADRERRALMGHYDYLSRYANDIILLTDDDGRIVEANNRAVAVYGYSREQLLGRSLKTLRHPSTLADFDAQWKTVADRDGYVFETVHQRRDGSAFPVEISVRQIDVDGARFRQSIIRDITDRRAMQERLRQANDKLAAIIEAAPVGIMVVDREARIRLWNKSAERIYGWKAEEVLDRPIPPAVWPAGGEDAGQELWRRLAAGRPFTGVEVTRRRKDGSAVDLSLTSAPLFDSDGSTMGAIAVVADVTERKRAEEALRESERRVQTAVQASNTGLWEWNLRTNAVYYSPEWKAQLGYADEEIPNDFAEWETRLHPEDRERAIAAVRNYLANPAGAFESEFRMRHKDGSYRWILARAAVLRDANGTPLLMSGSHLDFTERKVIEEELRQSRRLIERILDATPDLLYIHDLGARRNLFANRQVAEFFGYTPSEFQAMGSDLLNRILHPDDAAAIAAHHQRCRTAADGEVLEIEYRMRHADGSWRWLHSRDVVFTRGEDGLATQILGVAQDVTERRRAEEALRTSEARLERAQKIAALGNWESGPPGPDPGRDLLDWSDEVYNIFGVSKESFTPDRQSFYAMVHPEDRERVRTAFLTSLEARKSYGVEHRIVRPDGTIRYVREHAEPEVDESGAVRMIGTVQDITEYKRLQDQFLQAQRLESVGRLAGGVAHDFNNLLTVIIGYSDLILAQLDPEASETMPMEEIRKAAERAAELTGQLLAFSRKQIVQPKLLDLNVLIADIENMVRRLIGEDVELIIHPGATLQQVLADPGQITQVLMNLAVNARDAMPNGGKLILETRNAVFDASYAEKHPFVKPGSYVLLVVSDNGVGMDEETRNHLFEPFFTTKEKGKGTGLGLSTVYGIVRQAGGHIWVYSEPGVGTTFNICFPPAAGGADTEEPASAPVAALRGSETVLVVEDQQEVRGLAREVLQGYGYEVLEAGGGGEALDLCRIHDGPIHLLLTDVVMPVMTGRELAERFKELRPETKVLFMSGYTDNVIVHHGALDPELAYLQKPFSPLSLAQKVRATLDASA